MKRPDILRQIAHAIRNVSPTVRFEELIKEK